MNWAQFKDPVFTCVFTEFREFSETLRKISIVENSLHEQALAAFLYLIINAHHERANFELLYFKILGYFPSELVKEFAQEKFLLGTDCFYFLPVFYRISHLTL